MALTSNLSLPAFGLELNGAYIRIEWLAVNLPRDKYIDAYVNSYATPALRQEGVACEKHKVISIPKEIFKDTKCEDNALLSCAYNYLKTLPEYAGATDN